MHHAVRLVLWLTAILATILAAVSAARLWWVVAPHNALGVLMTGIYAMLISVMPWASLVYLRQLWTQHSWLRAAFWLPFTAIFLLGTAATIASVVGWPAGVTCIATIAAVMVPKVGDGGRDGKEKGGMSRG